MASEPVEELPDDLEAWVAERAAADGTSRADVVRRLMAAHRLLDEQPDRLNGAAGSDADVDPAVGPEDADALAAELEALDARVGDLTDRVGGVETDLDEKITDVRERVIQVKRETDAKAPADHDHPDLESRMDEQLERLEGRIDEGFENYEEILEYLTQRTDDLADDAADRGAKLRTVANAVVDLRRRVAAIETVVEERAAVAALRESANQQGIAVAACDSCGGSVRLGLLDEPACPHCESPFDGVEPGGWFRSARLTVGDVPALEAGTADSADDATLDGADAMASDATDGDGAAAPPNDTDGEVRSETGATSDAGAGVDAEWSTAAESDAADAASDEPDANASENPGAFDFGGTVADDSEDDTGGSDPEAADR